METKNKNIKNITYNGQNYQLEVVLSNRKTLVLSNKKDNIFVLKAPNYYPDQMIDEFFERNIDSLLKKISKRMSKEKNYNFEEQWFYLFGKKEFYFLSREKNKIFLNIKNRKIVVKSENSLDIQTSLKKFLQKELHNFIYEKQTYYQVIMEIPEHSIVIKNKISSWGSNAIGKKRISYAMNLIFFDPEVIESVIVHELSHYFVLQHNKDFYNIVYRFFPKYDEANKKLNSRFLSKI